MVESGRESSGCLAPTSFERSQTSLTHIPVRGKEAGGRQRPFAPKASVLLSLSHLYPRREECRLLSQPQGSAGGRREVAHLGAFLLLCCPVLFCWGSHNKCHRLGGLNNRAFFPNSSGGQKSKIKVSAGLVPLEASLLGLGKATVRLCHLTVFPLTCLCANFLFLLGHRSYGLRPTLITSFKFITS